MSTDVHAPLALDIRAFGVEPDTELGAFLRRRGARCDAALDFAPSLVEEGADVLLFRGDTLHVLSLLLAAKESVAWRRVPVLLVLTDDSAKRREACSRAGAHQCFGEPPTVARVESCLAGLGRPEVAGPDTQAGGQTGAIRIRELVLAVRSVADAEAAARFLAGFCPHPMRQGLGLAELFINAVEHGSLELDGAEKQELLRAGRYAEEIARRARDPRFSEREVTVCLRRFPTHVEVACEDQGPGFDWRELAAASASSAVGPSGRGIALARDLAFDSVEYVGRGNVVVARARADGHGAPSGELEGLSSWERSALELRVECLEASALGPDFFEAALALAMDVTDGSAGYFVALDGEQRFTILAGRGPEGARGVANEAGEAKHCPDPTFGSVLETGRPFIENAPHALCDGGVELRRSLMVPVLYAGQRLGVLHVADKHSAFTSRDALRLQTVSQRLAPLLAARVSAALAARRSAELEREWSKSREEQEVARHLVGRLLQEGCLDAPGIRSLVAAKEVFSGDLALAARLPSGGLRWMLGDFVGHGLPAAIGGLPLASVFYATTKKGVPLHEVVATMNERQLATLPRGFFCAAILLELEGGRLRYWNGGMPTACLRRATRRAVEELPPHDVALGVVASSEMALAIGVLEMGPQDCLYCYSDGLVETRSPSGEFFGQARAARVIAEAPPEEAFDSLLAALAAFRGAAQTVDDVSLVAVTGKATSGVQAMNPMHPFERS
ncbi:MAG TPA: SpoIIE family protein phosphatase [Polyangiaceae bacterium]|nr:SpoIIE family protein phosphatase [Polyangiaceae bacterium]